MTATAPPPGPSEETLGALIATASRDLSTLVRGEIELAKAEIRVDVKNGVTGGAMFGAAGFLVVLGVILLSVAAAYGLVALGLHPGLVARRDADRVLSQRHRRRLRAPAERPGGHQRRRQRLPRGHA